MSDLAPLGTNAHVLSKSKFSLQLFLILTFADKKMISKAKGQKLYCSEILLPHTIDWPLSSNQVHLLDLLYIIQ